MPTFEFDPLGLAVVQAGPNKCTVQVGPNGKISVDVYLNVRFTGEDKAKAENGSIEAQVGVKDFSGSGNPRFITDPTQFLDLGVYLKLEGDALAFSGVDLSGFDISAILFDRYTLEYLYSTQIRGAYEK